jgi:hypothetical protein
VQPLPQRFEVLMNVSSRSLGKESIVRGDDDGGMLGHEARQPSWKEGSKSTVA